MGGIKMKRQMMLPILAGCLLVLAWSLVTAAQAASEATPSPAGISLDPPALVIDTFYAGRSVSLKGEVADGERVILEVLGPREDATFDVKGRVGPFWLNRGLVKVENAPSLYMLLLPDDAPDAARLESLGLGMGQLKTEARVAATGHNAGQLFAQFLEFKQGAGLYLQRAGAVSYAPAGPGRRAFSASLDFPSALAAGEYQVIATVLREGAAPQRLEKSYLVEDGHFLGLIKGLAFSHSLLFGVLCVVIALLAGGVMGLVFKGGKGGH